ncbi:MAG: hypothetical protein JSW11_18770 [Candidatus Heimdallarchaeota archaeon]|nr:MAG: hypothetical protein JSW11_18770 [Candidatus Heimdallarchaeota archaeon]
MTIVPARKDFHQKEQIQPVCLKHPQKKHKNFRIIGPLILITLFVGFLILLPQGEQNSSTIPGIRISEGDLVWSETFDTAEEWKLQGFDYVDYKDQRGVGFTWEPEHTPIVKNGVLEMLNTQTGWYYSQAIHTSTVAYGTWSFDWCVNPGSDHLAYDVVFFIANNYIPTEQSGDLSDSLNLNTTAYVLSLTSGHKKEGSDELIPAISLAEWRTNTKHLIYYDYHEFSSPLEGAYHIDITRNVTGEFHIYLDQELILKVTDRSTTTSENFIFASWFGDSLFDNLTVSSTVDVVPLESESKAEYPPLVILVVPIGVIIFLRKKLQT